MGRTMSILSVLLLSITNLSLAFGAKSKSSFELLKEQAHRPRMEQIEKLVAPAQVDPSQHKNFRSYLIALQKNGISYFDYTLNNPKSNDTNLGYGNNIDNVGLIQLVLQLELQFPGYTFAPMGRDVVSGADYVDAFYRSLGHSNRMKPVRLSGSSFSNSYRGDPANDPIVQYLLQDGIIPPARTIAKSNPILFFDHTSYSSSSQSRQLMNRIFAYYMSQKVPVEVIVEKIRFITDQETSVSATSQIEIKIADAAAIKSISTREATSPNIAISVEANIPTYADFWHGKFGPIKIKDGKAMPTITNIETPDIKYRETIATQMLYGHWLVNSPSFKAQVASVATKLGFKISVDNGQYVVSGEKNDFDPSRIRGHISQMTIDDSEQIEYTFQFAYELLSQKQYEFATKVIGQILEFYDGETSDYSDGYHDIFNKDLSLIAKIMDILEKVPPSHRENIKTDRIKKEFRDAIQPILKNTKNARAKANSLYLRYAIDKQMDLEPSVMAAVHALQSIESNGFILENYKSNSNEFSFFDIAITIREIKKNPSRELYHQLASQILKDDEVANETLRLLSTLKHSKNIPSHIAWLNTIDVNQFTFALITHKRFSKFYLDNYSGHSVSFTEDSTPYRFLTDKVAGVRELKNGRALTKKELSTTHMEFESLINRFITTYDLQKVEATYYYLYKFYTEQKSQKNNETSEQLKSLITIISDLFGSSITKAWSQSTLEGIARKNSHKQQCRARLR